MSRRIQARLAAAILAVACCSLLGRVSAQQTVSNPLKTLTLEQLANVEVTTVSKEPERVFNTAAAIYVITQDDIRRSGATSLADALRLAPGVEVGRISSTTWAVGIRGLQNNFSKSVLVLIDGRSVYTPLFAGVYWDVQDVPLEDIDRIEVIRGPGGTVWGANSANGVINIITKSAAETHGALVSALGGGVDRFNGKVQYGGGNGKGLDYRIFAKGFVRRAEFHSDGDNFDDWHQERGGFRTDWKPNERDAVMVQGDMYRGDSPHRIGTTDVNDVVAGGDVLARWRRDLGHGSDIYLQTYFDRTIRIGSLLGETRNTIDVDFIHHFIVAGRHEIIWGGGLRWSPNRFVQKQPAIDIVPQLETDHIYSGFAQDEIHLAGDRVSLTFGAKLQHNNFSGFDILPTARVLWTAGEHQSFWAAVTRAVTTPSRIEEGFELTGQLSATPLILLRVAGNPHFKSEPTIGYEGGYRRLIRSNLYVDLSVFHNDYRDLQSFGAPVTGVETTPPPPHLVITIPYTNQISGATNGFEVAPSWTVAHWWKLAGSYSLVATDLHAVGATSDISSTGSVKTYEGSTPRHMVEIQSLFNLPKKFEFDQFYRYASVLPAQKVKPYHTVDLRLGWKPNPTWEFSVVGQNLLQPHHLEWGTGDPGQTPVGIRRTGYVKATWTK